MLYSYGMKVGAKLLLRGKVRESLPYLIRPVNYWRTVEYELVLRAAGFRRGERVLDIGSPKLLSLYLAKILGVNVCATDIDDYFVAKHEYVRGVEDISSERLQIGVEDGRKLSFGEGAFDKVYSISVLEHIPGEGDSDCVQEIARVLRPGGRAYITVPFWPEGREEYIDPKSFYWASHSSAAGEKVFYQRRYSEEQLMRRIVVPSGLKLVKTSYVGEKLMVGSSRELSDYLPAITGPVQPLMAKMFLSGPVDSWRALQKPLCALVVLEK